MGYASPATMYLPAEGSFTSCVYGFNFLKWIVGGYLLIWRSVYFLFYKISSYFDVRNRWKRFSVWVWTVRMNLNESAFFKTIWPTNPIWSKVIRDSWIWTGRLKTLDIGDVSSGKMILRSLYGIIVFTSHLCRIALLECKTKLSSAERWLFLGGLCWAVV